MNPKKRLSRVRTAFGMLERNSIYGKIMEFALLVYSISDSGDEDNFRIKSNLLIKLREGSGLPCCLAA